MAFKHQVFGASPLMRYSLSHIVEWSDHLSVDHPGVDAQHKLIFERVGEVHDLWRRNAKLADLRVAVDRLAGVLETHFHYEERMLAETAYPNLAEHAAEHRALLDELAAIRGGLGGDGKALPESGWALLDFLLGVTVGHIVSSDIEYCRYVAANPVDELDVSIAAMSIG
jgi:hemerythrin